MEFRSRYDTKASPSTLAPYSSTTGYLPKLLHSNEEFLRGLIDGQRSCWTPKGLVTLCDTGSTAKSAEEPNTGTTITENDLSGSMGTVSKLVYPSPTEINNFDAAREV